LAPSSPFDLANRHNAYFVPECSRNVRRDAVTELVEQCESIGIEVVVPFKHELCPVPAAIYDGVPRTVLLELASDVCRRLGACRIRYACAPKNHPVQRHRKSPDSMSALGRKRTLASEPTSALPQYPLSAKSGHRRRTRRSPAFCLAGNAAIRCCEVRPASPLPNTCGACCGLTLVSRCGAHASAASRRNVVTATQPRCTTHSPSALSPIAPAIGRGQASAIFDSVRHCGSP